MKDAIYLIFVFFVSSRFVPFLPGLIQLLITIPALNSLLDKVKHRKYLPRCHKRY